MLDKGQTEVYSGSRVNPWPGVAQSHLCAPGACLSAGTYPDLLLNALGAGECSAKHRKHKCLLSLLTLTIKAKVFFSL